MTTAITRRRSAFSAIVRPGRVLSHLTDQWQSLHTLRAATGATSDQHDGLLRAVRVLQRQGLAEARGGEVGTFEVRAAKPQE